MTLMQVGALVFLGGSVLIAALTPLVQGLIDWRQSRAEARAYGKHSGVTR